jgi:hypothetical protein
MKKYISNLLQHYLKELIDNESFLFNKLNKYYI